MHDLLLLSGETCLCGDVMHFVAHYWERGYVTHLLYSVMNNITHTQYVTHTPLVLKLIIAPDILSHPALFSTLCAGPQASAHCSAGGRPCPACRLEASITGAVFQPSVLPNATGKYDWTKLVDGQLVTITTSPVALPAQTSSSVQPSITVALSQPVNDLQVGSCHPSSRALGFMFMVFRLWVNVNDVEHRVAGSSVGQLAG